MQNKVEETKEVPLDNSLKAHMQKVKKLNVFKYNNFCF